MSVNLCVSFCLCVCEHHSPYTFAHIQNMSIFVKLYSFSSWLAFDCLTSKRIFFHDAYIRICIVFCLFSVSCSRLYQHGIILILYAMQCTLCTLRNSFIHMIHLLYFFRRKDSVYVFVTHTISRYEFYHCYRFSFRIQNLQRIS